MVHEVTRRGRRREKLQRYGRGEQLKVRRGTYRGVLAIDDANGSGVLV